MRQQGWRLTAKVLLDKTIAASALIIFSPVMVAIGSAIWLAMGRPILFVQRRPGRNAQPFDLFKFRTMSTARSADGTLLPDAQRITRVGRILRASSLDELPQLFNVLKGEMSLVGPRPLLTQYLSRYNSEQATRHDVLPGITGWAQVNGRNAISWEERFALDTWYVRNWSLLLDLRILVLTVLRVVQRKGISSAGHATMPEFVGSEEYRN